MNKVTLREWVLFLTLFPTTAIGLTLAVFYSYARVNDLEQEVQNNAQIIAEAIAQSTGYAVDNNNFVGLTRLANTLHRDNSEFINAIMVFNPRNKTLVDTSQRFSSEKYQLPISEIRSQSREFIDSGNEFRLIYPIELQVPPKANLPSFDKFYGYVQIIVNKENLSINQQNMIFTSLLMVLMTIIISSLLARKLIHIMSKPIAEMNDVVLNIREGILSARVKTVSEGEIEQLRMGINNMAQAIEDYQQDLEENIDQATLDLRENLERFEAQNVELDLSRRKAQEASRVKSEFLANMSHELRTPLNGVLGFTKQVLKTPLSDNQREFLATIEGSANNLLEIINDILDFSKLDSGRMIIESIPFSLQGSIEEVVTLLAPQAHQKNLAFSVNINPQIPNSLIGDAMRIKQIITNLLGNAIKFTQEGFVDLDIEFEILADSKIQLTCSVSDSGIGITEDNQQSLFEAFGQADNSITRLYGGTGLGLIIAKRLANEMGGDVGFTTKINTGSTFWASFQCEVNQLPIDNMVDPIALENQSIIYCEPNIRAQTATVNLMRHWKMNVCAVNSFDQMQQKLAQQQFDIALLGSRVTPSNIDDIKQEVKQLIDSVPEVHLAINNNSLSLKETFMASGARSCITKPLMANNLINCLSSSKKQTGRIIPALSQPNLENQLLPIKVLAVDDNLANLKLISTLLSEHVEQVCLAKNGLQALEMCRKETYALIFMDIQMPIMDGITALQEIKNDSLNSQTDIIAVTAHAMPGEKEKLLNTGFDAYMTKPIDETLLTHFLFEHSGIAELAKDNKAGLNDQFYFLTNESSNNSVFDWKLALQRSGNRPKLAAEMLVMLVDSLPETQETLQHAIKQENLPSMSATIHKLNGACCYNGVPGLEKISKHIETQIKQNHTLYDLEPELFELFDEIDKVVEGSKAFFNELHFDKLLKK